MSKASLELGGGNWAAKDTKLLGYAVGDTSGKYLPREFTFSRGADIGATRVNKDGLIEKYRENLFTYSNDFSEWAHSPGVYSITSGQTGYDGSTDAWLIDKTTDDNAYVTLPNPFNYTGVFTWFMYAKNESGTDNGLHMYTPGGQARFDLTGSGSIISQSSTISATIESIGSGWFKCSFNANGSFTTSDAPRFKVVNTDGTNSAGKIYVQHAQLERGLVATDYLESGSTTGKAGVLDNLPRIDYTSGSAQLLMEPTRTNYFEQSEYIASSYWFKENVTITQNDATSPEGVYNAVKLIDNSTEARHRISQATSFTSGTDYTLSVFVKKNSSGRFLLLNANTAFKARAALNLDTLEVTNINGTKGKVEDYGNGWYRFSVSGQATSTTSTSTYIQMQDSASDVDYVGDGSSFYLYGVQVEAGSYATSYIPTYGAADTRNNDYMSFLATNFYSTTSYTYFLDINLPNDVGITTPLWKDNDSLPSNGGFQVRKTTNTGSYVGITTHDGSSYRGLSTDVLTGRLKFAIIYDNGQVSVYYNGVQSESAISVTGWDQSTNHFKFGEGGGGLYEPNQFSYFPTALTPQEAISLTTL